MKDADLKVIEYLRAAADGARVIEAEGDAARRQDSGLVALNIRAVVPANVAAVLSGSAYRCGWDSVPELIQFALGRDFRADIGDLPDEARDAARLANPRRVGVQIEALVPHVSVTFETPTPSESADARGNLAAIAAHGEALP